MSTYAYEPLGACQIRMLELFPGKTTDPLTGCLETYSLSSEDTPELDYEALSYVWGRPSEDDQIYLLEIVKDGRKDNPRVGTANYDATPLMIGRSLALALYRLRRGDQARHLWCDQICIDQSNVAERSAQVGLMGKIYQKTSCVIVWLGPEADDSALAIAAMDKAGSQLTTPLPRWELASDLLPGADPKYVEPGLQPFTPEEWQACGKLVQRDWFKRLWVRQEIALAPQAIVVVGSSTISWSRLANAISCLHNKATHAVEEFRASLSQTLLDALNIARIRPCYGHFVGWVALTKNCECTDDRDRVYALLNLYAPDDPVVQPDYTLSVKDVYTSIVTQFGGLGDLKLLQFCSAAKSTTWVPDLHALKDAPGLLVSLTSEASANSGAVFHVINGDKVEVAGVLCGIVSKSYNPPAELSDGTIKETTVQLLKEYLGRDHEQWRQESLEKFAEAVIGWCAFEQTKQWPNPEVSFVVASLRHWAEVWSLVNEQDGADSIIRLARFFNCTMQARESDSDHRLRVVSEFLFLQALRQTFKRMMPLQLQDGSIAIGPAECQSSDR